MKLWHFYHVYAPEHQQDVWRSIVNEHIDAILLSSLSLHLNNIFIGVVGKENNARTVSDMFSRKNVKHEICAVDDFGWEQLTQMKLYEFSANNNGYVFYAHTKGAAHPSAMRDSHRRAMNDNSIYRWSENIDLISQGFTAVGSFFLRGSPEERFVYTAEHAEHNEENPNVKRYRGFFAGNFWWCDLESIRKMGRPSMENRIKAEAWMNNLYDCTKQDRYMVYDMLPEKLHTIIDF